MSELTKLSSCLMVLMICLCDSYALDQTRVQTPESLAIQLLNEASLTEDSSGCKMIEFNGKKTLVAVGEGVPQDGTQGAVAERTARYAAFIVAKGEIIKLLNGKEINTETEIVKKVVIKDTIEGSSIQKEKKITQKYNAFYEGVLCGIVPLLSTYDVEKKVARVVVKSTPKDASDFNRFGPGIRVADSLDNAMDSLEREALLGVIPPTGVTIVIVKDGTTEEGWLLSWGSEESKSPINDGRLAVADALRALASFVNGTELEGQDSSSKVFSKRTTQFEQASSAFYSDALVTLESERIRNRNLTVKTKATHTIIRTVKQVGQSDWFMVFAGCEYTLLKPGSSSN